MGRWHYVFLLALLLFAGLFFLWRGNSSESLEGIDANHDGVRDDVEKFILEKYPDERIRIAANEWHRSIQESILSPETYDPKRQYRACDCLYFLDSKHAPKIILDIEAQTANTRERIKAYWKAEARFSGTMIPAINPRKEACSFDKLLLEGQ